MAMKKKRRKEVRKMVGNRSDFKRFLKHMLAEMEDGRDNTMSSHYALTEDEMNKMVGEILCDLTVCKTFSEVIDKHLIK